MLLKKNSFDNSAKFDSTAFTFNYCRLFWHIFSQNISKRLWSSPLQQKTASSTSWAVQTLIRPLHGFLFHGLIPVVYKNFIPVTILKEKSILERDRLILIANLSPTLCSTSTNYLES